MTLRECQFKGVYRTEEDDLLSDFYIPALSQSVSYDRAVGYFSAAMLSYAAQGLTAFLKNEGKMRLIIGAELTEEESEAIDEGYRQKKCIERLGEEFAKSIAAVDDNLFEHRMRALSWMIAAGRLDIKVALRKQGMYHEKMGIMTDNYGNTIVFQGSANETASALRPDLNFESITVFRSWEPAHAEFSQPYKNGFEKLWTGNSKNTFVFDFPEAIREKLILNVQRFPSQPKLELEKFLANRGPKNVDVENEDFHSKPRIPEFIGALEYELREHQRTAIQKWINNEYHGIFALATGAGKTITSIHAAVRLYEAEIKRNSQLCVVIAVPYINLADQWREILSLFGFRSIPCYRGKTKWHERLTQSVSAFNAGARDHLCLVVVNATLGTDDFQQLLKQIPMQKMLWIGDECHHHGSEKANQALPENAKYRIGLSATPEHYIDEEANSRLTKYYGDIVATYTLADAINDGVLAPYRYYPKIVTLTEDEAMAYRSFSNEIAMLMAAKLSGARLSDSHESSLQHLLMKRARLIGSAENKILALREILRSREVEPHTLFYCGDGSMPTDEADEEPFKRQIEVISKELHKLGWKTSRFTAAEPAGVRDDILENFRVGAIDAMVAIRCLDEGIDIPACRTAFLLASARNPRQFIQRRGRILRKSLGKEFSIVYDFLVQLPDADNEETFEVEKRLVEAELLRIAEFANMSLNPTESYEVLEPLLDKYDLEHLIV